MRREIRATPPRIWHFLTDPRGVLEWLYADAVDLDARAGGRFRVSWCEGRNDLVGRLLVLEPYRRVTMEWVGAGGVTEDRGAWRLHALSPRRTRVEFAHRFHYGPASHHDACAGARADWEQILDSLQARSEGGPAHAPGAGRAS